LKFVVTALAGKPAEAVTTNQDSDFVWHSH
jgi:hypothetical protein